MSLFKNKKITKAPFSVPSWFFFLSPLPQRQSLSWNCLFLYFYALTVNCIHIVSIPHCLQAHFCCDDLQECLWDLTVWIQSHLDKLSCEQQSRSQLGASPGGSCRVHFRLASALALIGPSLLSSWVVKWVVNYLCHLPHVTDENVLRHVEKPVKKVGEQRRPTDVPTFAEHVGVLKLIETRDGPPGTMLNSILSPIVESSHVQEHFCCLRVKISHWYFRCCPFYRNSWQVIM